LLDFDKKYNTPAINNIITKTSSILLVFFIGYFVFRETYSMKQIVGIITMVTGMSIMIY
jgi:drug/metabolite transporter (DMT)-like permease